MGPAPAASPAIKPCAAAGGTDSTAAHQAPLGERRSTWEEGVTKAAQIAFWNATAEVMRLEWLDYEGHPVAYAEAVPGDASIQSEPTGAPNLALGLWHTLWADARPCPRRNPNAHRSALALRSLPHSATAP